LDIEEVESLGLKQAGNIFPNELFAELALGNNALTRADFAKEVFGWQPNKSGSESWLQGIRDEWAVIGKAASSSQSVL
jgi:hypothetical protein